MASLTAAVVRGLLGSTAVKGSAVVLALVSMISAGACFATLAGADRTPNVEMQTPRAACAARRQSHRPAVGRMADHPGAGDLHAAG